MTSLDPRDTHSLVSTSDPEKADSTSNHTEPLEDRPSYNSETGIEASQSKQEEEQSSNLPSLTDWNGDNDPDNPHNWSLAFRIYHVMVPGLFGFAVTFGTSVYTPAIADIMSAFSISRTTALLGLTVYTLGLGFGPIISAPLSEQHGRKIVYIASAPIFMLFTLGAGLSKSLASLIVCRFLAGLTGSPSLAIGAGTSADVFPPRQRAVVSSIFLLAPFMGPSLGPVVGGFAAQYKGWRWTQWCMIFISATVFLAALPMKETYKPIILKRRSKRAGVVPPKSVGSNRTVEQALVQNFLRPLHMLFTEPVVFSLSVYTAFAFAVLFSFFAAFPYVFSRSPYSFTISQSGLTFLGVGLGVLFAGLTSILIDRLIYQAAHRRALAKGYTHAQPEHRLYSAMVGSIGIPVGLFWFAWCADKGVHWSVLCVAAIPFAWGNLCLFSSAALYMVDVYGALNGASAIAANGILRYTLGAVFPLFTVQMYVNLGIGWATSVLGFLSLFMLPIPWILYKWGPVIRKRSRYPVVM